MNRRHFLRAAGASLALPAIARAAESLPPRRLVAIHVPLGMMPDLFFPKPGETTSPYLDLLAAHRSHFTTFAGLSHPEVNGNHHAGQCFLTGAPHPGQPTFRNSLSMDQVAAETVGLETRFPHLGLSVKNGDHYADSFRSSSKNSVSVMPMAALRFSGEPQGHADAEDHGDGMVQGCRGPDCGSDSNHE